MNQSSRSIPPVKARMRSEYKLRVLAMGVLFTVFALWFLKDGYIEYPRQTIIAEAYEAHQQQVERGEETQSWSEIAAENGWPDDVHGEPGEAHTAGAILAQKALGWGLLPIGLFGLGAWVMTQRRWIACDGQTITTHAGQRIPFEAVTSLDKSRWQRKGIAVVHYKQEGQQGEGRLWLDDWKYDTHPTRAIVHQLNNHLGLEHDEFEAKLDEQWLSSLKGPDGPIGQDLS